MRMFTVTYANTTDAWSMWWGLDQKERESELTEREVLGASGWGGHWIWTLWVRLYQNPPLCEAKWCEQIWAPNKLTPTVTITRWTWGSHSHVTLQTVCFTFGSWRRQWHPTPVLLPGKSHGLRSLVGCSPWGRWGSDTIEQLHFHFSLSCLGEGNGNPLHYSCLENPRDGSLVGCLLWGCTELETTDVT